MDKGKHETLTAVALGALAFGALGRKRAEAWHAHRPGGALVLRHAAVVAEGAVPAREVVVAALGHGRVGPALGEAAAVDAPAVGEHVGEREAAAIRLRLGGGERG